MWNNQLTQYTVHRSPYVFRLQACMNTNQAWMILECRDKNTTGRGNINSRAVITLESTGSEIIKHKDDCLSMHCTLPYTLVFSAEVLYQPAIINLPSCDGAWEPHSIAPHYVWWNQICFSSLRQIRASTKSLECNVYQPVISLFVNEKGSSCPTFCEGCWH